MIALTRFAFVAPLSTPSPLLSGYPLLLDLDLTHLVQGMGSFPSRTNKPTAIGQPAQTRYGRPRMSAVAAAAAVRQLQVPG